ncbi:MAG TPA: 1-phosphofructokinase family hexose kinase [Terriglobales bacterium]|jgi:1-phosphofructokinase family hexose kinase
MICTVSLNPAIDKYLRLPRLARGRHLEVAEVITSAGGKAINVAGVLRTLGETVELVGLLGGFTGAYILQAVEREGIRAHPVAIQAITRTAFVIVEEDGTETEVVEPGGAVSAGELDALRQTLREVAARASVIVLSGSVPPGCPDDIYLQLLNDCPPDRPVIVDTSRRWLNAVLDGPYRGAPVRRPTIIKPNRREAEAATGRRLTTPGAIERCLRDFSELGIELPCLSDGARGLYSYCDGRLLHARAPVQVGVNTVGSGDASVAGLAAGLARGLGIAATLRLAAACGAANAITKECAQVHYRDLVRLVKETYCFSVPSVIG